MDPNSTTTDMNKIELVQLVEVDNAGTASLGEIIEICSSDDEGAVAPNSSSADIIQIDCTDQDFADLLRLQVGVPVTPPTPSAQVVQMADDDDQVGLTYLSGHVTQPSTSATRQGNQVAVMNSQNLLQLIAASTNGMVTMNTATGTNYSTPQEEKPKAHVKPILADPKPPRKRVCLNIECQKSTPTLKKVDFVDLYYFGYPKSSKHKRICVTCDDLVRNYRQDLAKALEEKKSVFTVPAPFRTAHDVIIIDDDDEDEEETEPEEDATTYVVPPNVDEIIDEIISKIDVKAQRALCMNYLQNQLDDTVKWITEAEVNYQQLELKLAELKKIADNQRRRPPYMRAMLRGIDIDANGNCKATPPEASSSTWTTTKSTKSVATQSAGVKKEPASGPLSASSTVFLVIKPSPPSVGVPYTKRKQALNDVKQEIQDEPEVVTLGTVLRPKLELSPTPEPLPRVMPKVHDSIYGMKYTAKNYWLPGTIIDTRKNIFNTLEFKVQFETTKKGRPLTNPDLKDKTISVKFMSPKHIAYNKPCPFVLPVGTRVIARFKTDQAIPHSEAGFYFAGIVAEQPRNINSYRYLIFFDDGYAQYVGQYDVLLVVEASEEVWLDVHPDSQQFIRSYLLNYPEKAMLRLNKGSQVSMEYNGAWYATRVVEVDASLVRVQFEKIKRTEWVYRGSSRLYPIFMKYRRQGRPSTSFAIRRNEGTIPIEYPDADVLQALNKGEPMARKKTSVRPVVPPSTGAAAKPLQLPKAPPVMNTANLPEFEGKLMKFRMTPRLGPRPFVDHECGPTCVQNFDPTLPELQGLSPLLQPIYLNWSREIGKYPKRHVYYRAPCGVRLRHYGELEEFLEKTNCNMGIEYFCYDLVVHPYAEFVALRQMYNIKDLSYGRENVAVQCINSIDHDYPDFVQYSATRIPGKGVTINLDDDFLSCCDCTDNCMDKKKCSCWRLTMEGAKFTSPHADPQEIGYEQRRLHQHVISGIYECNKKCKCRSTCSNRVAQNPLKWKLQVFKSSTKGWGVRPLNDIPTGSFICAYAGQLLNEISANEDGKTQGDEYLAELDYIEVIETFKEGFEAEVVDPESDSKQQMKDDPDFKIDSDEEADPRIFKKPSINGGDSSDEEALSTRRPSRFNPALDDIKMGEQKFKPTRQYFGKDESCYIMDAKTIGNIGRYLNHSCEPNVFVQNVFVDTHDLRFPWVCFFAYKHIRAGTELTWDYNYDIGSVPGKTMYCYCAAPECRGRLL